MYMASAIRPSFEEWWMARKRQVHSHPSRYIVSVYEEIVMLATRISQLTERPNSCRWCPNRHDYCRRKTARARISDKVCQVSRYLARQSDVMHVELESRKYRWSDGQALLSRASEVFALSLFRDFTTRSHFLSYAKKPTFVGHDDPRVNPTSAEMTTDS